MKYTEEIVWLLDRIESLENRPHLTTTLKNIWQGSYDVWECEQDRLDALEIPRRRMDEAQELGLIESKIRKGRVDELVWNLTTLGKQQLESQRRING